MTNLFPRIETIFDILLHTLPYMDSNSLLKVKSFLEEKAPYNLNIEEYLETRSKENQIEENKEDEFKFNYPLYLNLKPQGFYTLDYAFQVPHLFDDSVVREARGIKFDLEGNVIARPFAKFFNLGEYPEEHKKYDFKEAVLQEKLDGSMIHPLWVNNSLRLCTMAGITDVSIQCENETSLNESQLNKLESLVKQGITPILEYTSPKNRIVVKYDKPSLTLLALRDNYTGEFLDLEHYSALLSLPTPKVYTQITVEEIKEWKNKEGVVAVFPNGYRIKLKCADYVLKHKTKDALRNEKDALEFILNGELDDLSSLLGPEDYSRLLDYRDQVFKGMQNTLNKVDTVVNEYKSLNDRKQIALNLKSRRDLTKIEFSLFWLLIDGRDPWESINNLLKKKNKSVKGRQEIRYIIGPEWEF